MRGLRVEAILTNALAGRVGSEQLKIVRYFIAGVLISIGYTLTVVMMVEWTGWLRPSLASAASFAFWTPVSYYGHRDFTFRFEGEDGAAAGKFLITFVLRLAASAGVVYVAVDLLAFHYLFGVFMNWIVLPLISYFVLKLWVFRAGKVNDMECCAVRRLP
jgi:putative flippase GtrA